jgi:hypothetical protein
MRYRYQGNEMLLHWRQLALIGFNRRMFPPDSGLSQSYH